MGENLIILFSFLFLDHPKRSLERQCGAKIILLNSFWSPRDKNLIKFLIFIEFQPIQPPTAVHGHDYGVGRCVFFGNLHDWIQHWYEGKLNNMFLFSVFRSSQT